MFVLERILRNFSESSSLIVAGVYEEMINKIEEWRNGKIANSEYHERLRLLVLPYLKESISKLIRLEDVQSNLKVFLFANDHTIELTLREIDWTAVMKRLIESGTGSENRGVTVRLLRYLRVNGREREIEEISLLATNTINKLLLDPSAVSFALQLLNSFPLKYFEDNPVVESNLLKILRYRTVNDRLKMMSIKLIKEKCTCKDEVEIQKMLGNYDDSAGLMSILKSDSNNSKAPVSSSKVINFLNGHFGQFSKMEQSILKGNSEAEECSNGYEEFLCALVFNNKKVSDGNVLRYLLKNDKITVEEFIEKAQVMNVEDYEIICEKSEDPEIIFEFLKLIPTLSIQLREKTIRGDINANISDILSLPAQWHLFKQYKPADASKLYEKYGDNFDGSGDIFKPTINDV